MGMYNTKSAAENVKNAKSGGQWMEEREYDVKLSSVTIEKGQSKKPGFKFECKVIKDKELRGKKINLFYWFHLGFKIDNFTELMQAFGFDFTRVDDYEEKSGEDWEHEDWINEGIFDELEEAGPTFKIAATPQKNDKTRFNCDPVLDTIPKIWDGAPVYEEDAKPADNKPNTKAAASDDDDDDIDP